MSDRAPFSDAVFEAAREAGMPANGDYHDVHDG
jgi:hypothetical protein